MDSSEIAFGLVGLVIAVLFGLVSVAIAGSVLLGWIVLLVMGISRLRKGASAGLVMTVIGGFWAAVAVAAVGLGVVGYRYASSALVPTDFDPAGYHGKVGAIILPSQTPASLVLAEEKSTRRLRVEVSSGRAKAPVGSYKVESYSASMTDASGNEWSAEWTGGRDRSQTIAVGPAPVHLDVGPPFVATVKAETRRERADFDLQVTGSGNRSYTLMNADARAGPPRFEVLDGSGNVVWHGNFEYG
jgi:hypothetical protein